ncbi:hypothetical protein Poly59_36370 [Rubripirellula reticaptiva]|uniref:Uncharacterized protein n=1 Tax=Rubripirellula reticaptiva TaxID=2528013 RepID=A0A5C6EUR2_9BACT|nr:hypothetical protein Poly59_36370 [Rubripirellula reticaptiva]
MIAIAQRDTDPGNPYKPPSTLLGVNASSPFWNRWDILIFCAIAYSLHVLALWGIACFHDAHVGAELREPFRSIKVHYGAVGLLGVALVYALLPAAAYLGICLVMNTVFRSRKTAARGFQILQGSLAVTLVADLILGLPLFTTG